MIVNVPTTVAQNILRWKVQGKVGSSEQAQKLQQKKCQNACHHAPFVQKKPKQPKQWLKGLQQIFGDDRIIRI